MKGGNCAGLSLSKNSGLMGDQSPCEVDLPTRVRWISNDTFMMVEKNQTSSDKPPRVYLYKIKSLQVRLFSLISGQDGIAFLIVIQRTQLNKITLIA